MCPSLLRKHKTTNPLLGFTTRSFRRGFLGEEDRRIGVDLPSGRPPVATRKKSDEKVVEDFLATGKLSSLDRVRSYLEGLRQCRDEYEDRRRRSSLMETNRDYLRSTSSLPGSTKINENGRKYGLVSEFEKFSVNKPIQERNLVSQISNDVCSEPQEDRVTKKNSKKDTNESRVTKTIKQLRKNSAAFLNEISESNLLKRAVSLEDINKADSLCKARASSLKPEESEKIHTKKDKEFKKSGFLDALNKMRKEDRELRIANLKKLEFAQKSELSAESTPTGDIDEQSLMSVTDNSDTWSSCDLAERLDMSSEDCVSERIRRKSFYHRFNVPKRHNSYHRSISNLERKRFY